MGKTIQQYMLQSMDKELLTMSSLGNGAEFWKHSEKEKENLNSTKFLASVVFWRIFH